MPKLPRDASVHVVNSTHFIVLVQSIARLVSIYSVLRFVFKVSRLHPSFLGLGQGTASFFLLTSPFTLCKLKKLGCSLPDHKHGMIITLNTKPTILNLAR